MEPAMKSRWFAPVFALACALLPRWAEASHVTDYRSELADTSSCTPFAIHTATMQGDLIRWEMRVFGGCAHEPGAPVLVRLAYPLPVGSELDRASDGAAVVLEQGRIAALSLPCPRPGQTFVNVRLTTPRAGAGARSLLTPPLLAEGAQLVAFSDRDVWFRPGPEARPRYTRRSVELGTLAPGLAVETLARARAAGVPLTPATLIMLPNAQIVLRQGIEGRLEGRRSAYNVVLTSAALVSCGVIAGLWAAHRRLLRRGRLEAAQAMLRADTERGWPALGPQPASAGPYARGKG
jgi:hypothetical protein